MFEKVFKKTSHNHKSPWKIAFKIFSSWSHEELANSAEKKTEIVLNFEITLLLVKVPVVGPVAVQSVVRHIIVADSKWAMGWGNKKAESTSQDFVLFKARLEDNDSTSAPQMKMPNINSQLDYFMTWF